jgi:3D (Asp-Asp-Asp) domain-containing protein
MQHPDIKGLIWGRHLQRLLAACGVTSNPKEPPPRVVGRVPPWFQRLGAILTLLGLVGGIRIVDRAISPRPSSAVREAEMGALDGHAWNQWINGAWSLRFNASPGQNQGTVAAEPITVSLENPDSAADGSGLQAPPPEKRSTSGNVPHRFQRITVTAYTSRTEETDATPTRTATNATPSAGTIALSRDLIRTFSSGAPFEFGDKVLIPGVGIFEVRDTMNPRWTEKADIWLSSPETARQWGCRTVFLTRLEEGTPTTSPSVH